MNIMAARHHSTGNTHRRKFIRLPGFALALIAALYMVPSTAAIAEVIRSFDEELTLKQDCTLDIVENITMDFQNAERHGIMRWIPVVYKRHGGNYTLETQIESVTDEDGHEYSYSAVRNGDDLNLKIGSPNFTVTGVHIYKIHYTVRRAVNFFDSNPEVYWNVTGNESPFAIEKAQARFHPPAGASLTDVKAACFRGPQGSREPGTIEKEGDTIVFSATKLNPSEGLTIVAGLPAGSVAKPTFLQNILWFLKDWWPALAFPVGTAYLLFIIWWYSGRDPGRGKAVAVEWNPPKDLTPAQVGTVVDESCDIHDIVSTLIDLAARGYLRIKQVENPGFLFMSNRDYQFVKTSKPDIDLLPYEKVFLSGLFRYSDNTSLLSDLRYKFYEHLPYIKREIYQSLIDKNLFAKNPEEVRNSFNSLGITLGILGLVCMIISQLALGIGLFLSGLFVVLSARAMPARTREGAEKYREILGFYKFVNLAEKRRIAELAKDDPTIFGRLLPYAMVLGVADKWANAFKDLLTAPPDWYEPYGWGTDYNFSPSLFVNDIGGAMHTMRSTFESPPPPPSSSDSGAGGGFSGFSDSGGFSGGGFGGGGTGSW